MPRSSVLNSVLTFILTSPVFGAGLIQPVNPSITVHEWGTFTSVAGEHGESVSWAPLRAASDLPCFVHRLGDGYAKYVPGLVRMETPVDYFYTQAPARVSVHVDFPDGRITEWYPKALNQQDRGSIDWNDLNILPGADLTLPASKGVSRYYAARATDSAPLQASGENEKLLFYRGMANFRVPVEPVYENDGVRIHVTGAEPLPLAILFENHDGHPGYRVARDVKDIFLTAPDLKTYEPLRSELIAELEKSGLYPKEAAAMLETWRDSWFEEGTRVIYLMPRAMVDKVLPLKVTPEPKETQRVFVGRVEILSPATERTIRAAMEANDTPALEKVGRFLQPFVTQMKTRHVLTESPEAAAYVQQVAGRIGNGAAPCIP